MNCEALKNEMADLLLDASFPATPAGQHAQAHVNTCAECREHLAGLRATMALMDQWKTAEPSPYFDTRMQVKMREEFARPQGFWQRLTGRIPALATMSARPLVAGAMAVAVVVGGATYAGVSFFEQPQPHAQESATLRDLQSLDRNAQVIDELNSLDQQLNSDDAGNASE